MRNLRLSGQMGSLLNCRYQFYRLHKMSCWVEVKGHDSCRRKLLFDIKVLPLWNKWHFYLSTQDSLCATGCADGVIRLFDLKSGRCLRFDWELIYLLVMFRILRQKEKPTYLLRALQAWRCISQLPLSLPFSCSFVFLLHVLQYWSHLQLPSGVHVTAFVYCFFFLSNVSGKPLSSSSDIHAKVSI